MDLLLVKDVLCMMGHIGSHVRLIYISFNIRAIRDSNNSCTSNHCLAGFNTKFLTR